MKQYLDAVKTVLQEGEFKENRTGISTISAFDLNYKISLSQDKFPILTTKNVSFKNVAVELLWFLSGDEHIRELRKHVKFWDPWAGEDGNVDTAYGRFWRKFPFPQGRFNNEAWANDSSFGDVNPKVVKRMEDGSLAVDQIEYVLDQLVHNPNSRRMVVTAWHPANAIASRLPPCHYTFVVSVLGNKLNLHLTQRSCDMALGVPYNDASYSLLAIMLAQEANARGAERQLVPGVLGHSLVDAHVYCGIGDRANFYKERLHEFQERLRNVSSPQDYLEVREWLESKSSNEGKYDHVPNLLLQLSREPRDLPRLIMPSKRLNDLVLDDAKDFKLEGYDPHLALSFKVAV